MRKKIITVIALALIFSFCLSVPAFAWDVRSNPIISYTYGSIGDGGNGNIIITFYVLAKGECSTIGASQIDLYSSNGAFKKTFYSDAYVTMLTQDNYSYMSSVDYPGTDGEKYYANITFYAVKDGESTTYVHTTSVGP